MTALDAAAREMVAALGADPIWICVSVRTYRAVQDLEVALELRPADATEIVPGPFGPIPVDPGLEV